MAVYIVIYEKSYGEYKYVLEQYKEFISENL